MTTMTPIQAAALRIQAGRLAALREADTLPQWSDLARPEQRAPEGDWWTTWLFLAGRGAGKTRSGAEWVKEQVEQGTYGRWAFVAPTAADVRDVMLEGESGLLSIYPNSKRPIYEPSKRRVTWPSGARATMFSADEPDRLRGPQHDAAWCDELGAWRRPEAWDMLLLGLRLGSRPRACVTTTPRPTKVLKDIMANPHTVITRGTTYDNLANLAPTFREVILARYEGTRLGRQELLAEILEDIEGAMWTRDQLDRTRRLASFELEMSRVVVGVDPPGGAVECGINVSGKGTDGHYYCLEDASLLASPDRWADRVIDSYITFKADRVMAEGNYGGDMVEATIRQAARARGISVSFKLVNATRGKAVRAEPIAALYEQNRAHMVGNFPLLEDEMCSFIQGQPGPSPNRMDALVWAMTELSSGGAPSVRFI